jgi:hypothetical protein
LTAGTKIGQRQPFNGLALVKVGSHHHINYIEFRPNDLASPLNSVLD